MENINCGIYIKLRLSDLCISDNDEVLFRYEYKYHCESLTVSLKHVFNDNLALNTYSNNKFGLFLEHFSVAILSSILPKKNCGFFNLNWYIFKNDLCLHFCPGNIFHCAINLVSKNLDPIGSAVFFIVCPAITHEPFHRFASNFY